MRTRPVEIPELPGLPAITEDRLVKAFMHFISEERSIEEVAAIEKMSPSSIRIDAKTPILKEAFYKVGERNGHDVVKTTMRQRWKSLDRFAEIQSEAAEAEERSRKRRRAE